MRLQKSVHRAVGTLGIPYKDSEKNLSKKLISSSFTG